MNERLSDYLLGELDGAERRRFEAELARDPALAAEAERLRPVVTRLESLDAAAWDLPEAPALPPLAPRETRRRPARRERRPAWWRRALVAAAARPPRRSPSSCSRSASAPACCSAAAGTTAPRAVACSRSTPSSRSAARRTAPRPSPPATAAPTCRSAG